MLGLNKLVLFFLCLILSASSVLADDSASYVVTRIRFFPRPGHAAEMVGGNFVGSITSATNDFNVMVRISKPPIDGQWNELNVPATDQHAYRFVKYESRNDFWGDIAEIEFYSGERKLSGTPFGTVGAKDPNNDPKFAFDDATKTFFRGNSSFGQYVGLDLGSQSQVPQPVVSAPSGNYTQDQKITFSTIPGATIVYSVDGGLRPTLDADGKPLYGNIYTGEPILVSKSCVIQATACKAGLADSVTTLAAYHIGTADVDAQEHAEFHIGNSLTDTINSWMEPLAASGGHHIRYYRFTIPGAPTDWLWDHPGTGFGENHVAQAFLARAPLTDLVTQPMAGHNRSIDNEADYSGRFFDVARKYSPNVQMWLYAQWPDAQFKDYWSRGVSSYNGHKVILGDPAKTWQEAVENHTRYNEQVMEEMNKARADGIKAGKCKPVLIIPGGLALGELRTRIEAGSIPGMTDFVQEIYHTPTDIHLSPKGSYLIALVHYACLYKDNPEGKVTYAHSGLTAEQAKLFQQIAWQVCKNYKYSGLNDK